MRDFDAFEVKGFDILAQGRESDTVAGVKVFDTWVEVTKLFQAAVHGL